MNKLSIISAIVLTLTTQNLLARAPQIKIFQPTIQIKFVDQTIGTKYFGGALHVNETPVKESSVTVENIKATTAALKLSREQIVSDAKINAKLLELRQVSGKPVELILISSALLGKQYLQIGSNPNFRVAICAVNSPSSNDQLCSDKKIWPQTITDFSKVVESAIVSELVRAKLKAEQTSSSKKSMGAETPVMKLPTSRFEYTNPQILKGEISTEEQKQLLKKQYGLE